MNEVRPDPHLILTRLKEAEEQSGRGRLKIFFGAVAGVGKTCAMLTTAHQLQNAGIDVVVGYVETHGRSATAELLNGLEVLPRRSFEYKNATLEDFDLDGAIARKPELILVDELAHTNASGSRHAKRWQDVLELLDQGIDVFTTLNVQHLESLNDVVSQITGVQMQERVPDSLLKAASEIELVDLPADELIQRLRDGKIYIAEKAERALDNFFRKGNLIALRELALRTTADHVDDEMVQYRQLHRINQTWPAGERMLVCVSNSPLSIRLVRSTMRMATALKAKWYVAFVETPAYSRLSEKERARVIQTLRLAEQLGAQTIELSGENVVDELITWAQANNITKIVVGKPARPRWQEILNGTIIDTIVRRSGLIDVYVISGAEEQQTAPPARPARSAQRPSSYVWSLLALITCTALAAAMNLYFELSNVIMIYMLTVVFIATRFGSGPAIMSSIISVACFDFFFVPPRYTFAVSDGQYLVTFAVMLSIALLISTMTARIRQQAEAARERERRTSSLYAMTGELSSNLDFSDLVATGLRHTAEVFSAQTSFLKPDSKGNLAPVTWPGTSGRAPAALDDIDYGVASWCYKNKRAAGHCTDTLPAAAALYVPLTGSRAVLGVLAIKADDQDRFLAPEQMHLLETFVSQLAVALERAQLAELQLLALNEAQAPPLANSTYMT
jgi:two-component system sensor histidine kinase KdpD